MRRVIAFTIFAGFVLIWPNTRVIAGDDNYVDGIIEPHALIEVSCQVQGILDEVLVERGDIIKAGQVLARLKSNIEQIAVDLALERLKFARRKAERNEELFRKELISISDRDEMETEIEIGELQLKEAMERLEMRTVKSPVSGVVVERFHFPGEYILNDPIYTVAWIDPLNVEVFVPVEKYGSISTGMNTEVIPELPGVTVHRAKVVIVDRVIDAASGTFGVRLEFPNPGYRLPAGLKCKVRFLEN